MAGGNLGIAGKIELAEMAALPPFTEMIADMRGLGALGSRGGSVSVHDGKPIMRISHVPLRQR
jgi:hypothetical protein